MTGYDVVSAALRYLGVYRIGQSIGPDDGAIGLATLNAMRASWAADGVVLYGTGVLVGTTGAGGLITFGTGGDVATRPVDFVSVIDATETDPCVLHRRTWAEMEALQRGMTGLPAVWSWDAQSPLSTLWTWPESTGRTIRCTITTALPNIANLSDTIPDPPEYEEALALGLAVRLGPQYGVPVPGEVAALSAGRWSSLAMRAAARRVPILRSDLSPSRTGLGTTDLVAGRDA